MKLPSWLYASIAAIILLSCYSLQKRYQVESKNKATCIVAEYEVLEDLASSSQMDIGTALKQLKQNGLGGVAISEEFVGSLIGSGNATVATGDRRGIEVSQASENRFNRGLQTRWKGQFGKSSGGFLPLNPSDVQTVRQTSLLFDPAACLLAKSADLLIVGRISNPIGASSQTVTESIKWASELGCKYFLPQGDQVLGRRDNLRVLVDALMGAGMLYATPEFSKIGGDANVVEMAPEMVVRLHSAQSQEIDKMTVNAVVERFVKAAKERGMRLLLLRPISLSSDNGIASFGELIRQVKSGLVAEGLVIGEPHPSEDSNVPSWVFVAIGVAGAPVVFWLVLQLIPGSQILAGILALLPVVAATKDSGRPYCALMLSMAFPIAAFVIADLLKLRNTILAYCLVSVVSLAGGLAVAGLLNGLPYFIHAEEFKGVKLAHFAPIAVIGIFLCARMTNLRATMRKEVNWGSALLAIGVLGALAFMATRTGNDSPAGVSGLELKFRDLLDAVLFVRPRTKEFLVGNPLLFVGLGMLAAQTAGKKTWAPGWIALFLTAGAIGQTSIVNTMCHFHTPLAVSLSRIGVGLVAGGIIGALLLGAASRLQPREGA